MKFRPDFTTTLTIVSAGSDSSVTIPQNIPDSMLSNPLDAGSDYFISVHGAPAAINFNAAAVVPVASGAHNAILEIGTNLTWPVNIPPGTVVHAISTTGTAIVSLIRARSL